jgi:hypothetical protein
VSGPLLPIVYPFVSGPLADPKLRAISDGMGVQSFAMKMMAARGLIGPMPDVSIFANTGDETSASLETLAMFKSDNWRLPFPIVECSSGNLTDDFDAAVAGEIKRFPNPPMFVENEDGSRGQLIRGCTRDYKITAVRREIRKLLGAGLRNPLSEDCVEMWLGITTDEFHRFAPSVVTHIYNRAPLLEAGLSRQDCIDWIWQEYQIVIPESGCRRCPFHDFASWAAMKQDHPEDFAVAVAADRAGRHGMPGVKRPAFLSDTLRPLDEIDFEAEIAAKNGGLIAFMDACDPAGGCRT